MKRILYTAAAIATALLAYAGEPRLVFAQREIDLGVFDGDSLQTAMFTVRNDGTGTLVIYRVHAACRCTHPGGYADTIAPGDSTFLTVRYNGKGHTPGRIRQAISLRTNAADPYATCYITGQIRRATQK